MRLESKGNRRGSLGNVDPVSFERLQIRGRSGVKDVYRIGEEGGCAQKDKDVPEEVTPSKTSC